MNNHMRSNRAESFLISVGASVVFALIELRPGPSLRYGVALGVLASVLVYLLTAVAARFDLGTATVCVALTFMIVGIAFLASIGIIEEGYSGDLKALTLISLDHALFHTIIPISVFWAWGEHARVHNEVQDGGYPDSEDSWDDDCM